MSTLATATFWKATAERAIKTVAQSAVALITAQATGLLDVEWLALASISGLAGLVSVLTSIASSGVGNDGPSLVGEELSE